MNIRSIVGLSVLLGVAAPLANAEMRVWMSRKGGVVEAELGKVEGSSVTLVKADEKEIKLSVEDLSLADRQYLVEEKGADKEILTAGEPGSPEKDVRIDSDTMKKLDQRLGFGDSATVFDLMETEHFLIGTVGSVRPGPTGETAERMWHGMAFEHMNFRKDWGSERMLILVVEDRDAHKALGEWYVNFLAANGQQAAVGPARATWDQVGSTNITISAEMAAKHGVMTTAIVFNVKDAGWYRKAMSPFPIHCIAKTLLAKQMGAVNSEASAGYFAVTTGHAYFKEIKLAGRTETNLLDVAGTGNDEISSKSGFEDGTSWARTLRPLVRKGKVKTEIVPMFQWKTADLTPERLVLIYAFAYYMQSDSARLSAYAALVREIEKTKKIPAPEEIAGLFGFESVEAFEEDWMTFVAEGEFR